MKRLKIFRDFYEHLPLISVTSEVGYNPKCYCLVVLKRKQLEFGFSSSYLSVYSYHFSVRFQLVDSTVTAKAEQRTKMQLRVV